MEENDTPYPTENNKLTFNITPFEVKTFRLV
jgi:hypothetical protein